MVFPLVSFCKMLICNLFRVQSSGGCYFIVFYCLQYASKSWVKQCNLITFNENTWQGSKQYFTIFRNDSREDISWYLSASCTVLKESPKIQSVYLTCACIISIPQVIWQILGPNSNEVLPSVNTDIGEPVNGTFGFRDGEGGVRSIELKILPHGEVEVTEKFIVVLSILSGEIGIDPKAGSVTLTVRPAQHAKSDW